MKGLGKGGPRHFAFALLCELVLLLVVARLAVDERVAASTIVWLLAASFLPYAFALRAAPTVARSSALRSSVLVVALAGLALAFAPPRFSDDVFRFVWEGRLWFHGHNPLEIAPNDGRLAHLRDDVWGRINNPSLASIYPPLSQMIFAIVAAVGGGVIAIKLLAVGVHATATVFVSRVTDDPRAPIALGLNPLLLSEGALNGHLNLLTGLVLLLAAWRLSQTRIVGSAMATIAAAALKVVGVVFLPLYLRHPKGLLAAASGSALVLAPMLYFRPSIDAASGSLQFATRWQGNESLYALVAAAVPNGMDEAVATVAPRIVVALAVLLVGVWCVHRRMLPLEAGRCVLWATLLLSPQVHPWYLAWLLPIDIACGRLSGLFWSLLVLCAYAPLDVFLAGGPWELPLSLRVLEYGGVAAALAFEARRNRVVSRPSTA